MAETNLLDSIDEAVALESPEPEKHYQLGRFTKVAPRGQTQNLLEDLPPTDKPKTENLLDSLDEIKPPSKIETEEDEPGIIGEAVRSLWHSLSAGNAQNVGNTIEYMGVQSGIENMQGWGKWLQENAGSFSGIDYEPTDKEWFNGLYSTIRKTAGLVAGGVGSSAPSLAVGLAAGAATGPAGAVVGPAAFFGVSYMQNAGEIYGQFKEEGLDKETSATWTGYLAPIVAGIDSISFKRLTGIDFAKDIKGSLIKQVAARVSSAAAQGAAIEGTTEGMQSVVREAAAAVATGNPDLQARLVRVIEESIAGAGVGGIFGGGKATYREIRDYGPQGGAEPTPPPTAPEPVKPPDPDVPPPPATEEVVPAELYEDEAPGADIDDLGTMGTSPDEQEITEPEIQQVEAREPVQLTQKEMDSPLPNELIARGKEIINNPSILSGKTGEAKTKAEENEIKQSEEESDRRRFFNEIADLRKEANEEGLNWKHIDNIISRQVRENEKFENVGDMATKATPQRLEKVLGILRTKVKESIAKRKLKEKEKEQKAKEKAKAAEEVEKAKVVPIKKPEPEPKSKPKATPQRAAAGPVKPKEVEKPPQTTEKPEGVVKPQPKEEKPAEATTAAMQSDAQRHPGADKLFSSLKELYKKLPDKSKYAEIFSKLDTLDPADTPGGIDIYGSNDKEIRRAMILTAKGSKAESKDKNEREFWLNANRWLKKLAKEYRSNPSYKHGTRAGILRELRGRHAKDPRVVELGTKMESVTPPKPLSKKNVGLLEKAKVESAKLFEIMKRDNFKFPAQHIMAIYADIAPGLKDAGVPLKPGGWKANLPTYGKGNRIHGGTKSTLIGGDASTRGDGSFVGFPRKHGSDITSNAFLAGLIFNHLGLDPKNYQEEYTETAQPEPDKTKTPAKYKPIKKDVVETESGRKVDVEYAVLDASDLIYSHDVEGNRMAGFPEERQNRGRERPESIQQMKAIASAPKPSRLAEWDSPEHGAPVVDEKGIVEVGNGRVAGLVEAYRIGTAEKYKEFVNQKAGEDAKGMKNPILVRVRKTEMTPEETRLWIGEGNKASQLELTATDKALTDADLIDTELMATYTGGSVSLDRNSEFYKQFASKLTDSERGTMFAEGRPSAPGIKRLESALLAKAFGDKKLVEKFTEAEDPGRRNVRNVLIGIAPMWSKVKVGIQAGNLHPDFDQTKELMEVVRFIQAAYERKEKVSDAMRQGEMFATDKLSPGAKAWMSIFYKDPVDDGWKKVRSFPSIVRTMKEFLDKAMKSSVGKDMFGNEFPSPNVYGMLNDSYKDTTGDDAELFDAMAAMEESFSFEAPTTRGAEIPGVREWKMEVDEGTRALRKEVLEELKEVGKKMYGPELKLDVVDKLFSQHQKAAGLFAHLTKAIYIKYEPGNIEKMKGTLGHEIIHLMKNTGALSKNQWSLMEKAADKGAWVMKHRIRDKYLDATEEVIVEEAVAREFQQYLKSPKVYVQPVGGIKGIFNKLRIFFDNLRNRFTKMGYKTPEALFNAVAGGELAGQGMGQGKDEGAMLSYGVNPPPKHIREEIVELRRKFREETGFNAGHKNTVKKMRDRYKKIAQRAGVKSKESISLLKKINSLKERFDAKAAEYDSIRTKRIEEFTKTPEGKKWKEEKDESRRRGNEGAEERRKEAQRAEEERYAEQERVAVIRKENIKTAARAARSLGYKVRSSKFDGLISSYYIDKLSEDGIDTVKTLRVSDHEIPWTEERESRSVGFYQGYEGQEIISPDTPKDNAWWKDKIERILEKGEDASEIMEIEEEGGVMLSLEDVPGPKSKDTPILIGAKAKITTKEKSIVDQMKDKFRNAKELATDPTYMVNQWLDAYHAIRKYGDETGNKEAYYMAETIAHVGTIADQVKASGTAVYSDGAINIDSSQKSFYQIISDVGSNRLEDFNAYLTGLRAAEIEKRGKNSGFETEEIDAMINLGEQHPSFKARERELHSVMKSMRKLMLDGGLIDEKAMRVWEKGDQHYVPFIRNLETSDETILQKKYEGIAGVRKPKKMFGSKLAIISPLESIDDMFRHTIRAVVINRARREILEFDRTLPERDRMLREIERDKKEMMMPALVNNRSIIKALEQQGIDMDAVKEDLKASESYKDFMDSVRTVWAINNDMEIFKDYIPIVDEGKTRYFDVADPNLFYSMAKLAEIEEPGKVRKAFKMAKNAFRFGTSIKPSYQTANVTRDFLSTYLMTDFGAAEYPKEYMKTIRSVLKGSKNVDDETLTIMANTMLSSTIYQGQEISKGLINYSPSTAEMKKMVDGFNKVGGKLVSAYAKTVGATETINRTAIAKLERQRGSSLGEAIHQARKVPTDHSMRGGALAARLLADSVPFLNSRVQGTWQVARKIGEEGSKGEKGRYISNLAARSIIRNGMRAGVASSILFLINNGQEWYEKIPEWEKRNYMHFKVPYSEVVRVPVPFELGHLFLKMPERFTKFFIDTYKLGTKRATGELVSYLAWFANDAFGLDLPGTPLTKTALINPIWQWNTNWDSFFERPVVPMRLRGQLPEAQYNAATTSTVRLFGELTGLPPVKVQKLLIGYLNGLATVSLLASDYFLYATGMTQKIPKSSARLDDWRTFPVANVFFGPKVPYNTKDIQDYYNLREHAMPAIRTIGRFNREAGVEKGKGISEKGLAVLEDNKKAVSAWRKLKGSGVVKAIQERMRQKRSLMTQQERLSNKLTSEQVRSIRKKRDDLTLQIQDILATKEVRKILESGK